MDTPQSWSEWKKKKEMEYLDKNGNPMPPFARNMLAYNGRTPGQFCADCANFQTHAKRPYLHYCKSYQSDRGAQKGNWAETFPACGLFQQKEKVIDGDKSG